MAGTVHSDDIDSDGTLRDILADLVSNQAESSSNLPPSLPSPPPQADSSWILPPYSPLPQLSSSNSPRPPHAPMPRTSSASRPAQQQIAGSTSHLSIISSPVGDTTSLPTLFNTPSRSIFSSGPPTASLSSSTAQASLSAVGPSSSSRPLAALSASSAGSSRRVTSRPSDPQPVAVPIRRRNLQISEKDVDDPSTLQATAHDTSQHNATATLSKLFVTREGTPNSMSGDVSYVRALASPNMSGDVSTLSGHLLQRGLIEGRHSDITIHAFGTSYRLHRLLLDRVPFFASAFSGSWAESSAREMTLHPEDMDSNITRAAFELTLKRVYGCYLPADEENEAVGLFATSCWLDMSNIVDSSVDILLRQMQPSKLDSMIKLVTKNYYGKAGDRILASAKAMLCREGWEMPYEYWDHIPSEIVREVVGGDPFFVPGEWERWYLALRLLNRRLKAKATEVGLITSSGRYLQPKPTTLNFFAVRFDTTYRRDLMFAGRGSADKDDTWIGLYTSPDIAPLLVLLDEGIHYVHLRFEQLQRIRQQKDLFGVPVLPEKVISDALWMAMELRQRVLNAQEPEMELGFSKELEPQEQEDYQAADVESNSKKGKQPEHHVQQELEMESGSWDGNGRPRKFWIPTSDSSSVMGGASEAYLTATSSGITGWNPHMSRLSASLEPSDVQWATDFTASGVDGRPGSAHGNQNDPSRNPRYSHYPPFRFSAEFPNPRTLKEKKRVYSQTVWYAGSMWNLYIQRVNTSKNQQLGIYLHRAKDKEPSDDPLALLASATVDDRIGQLEREMLMRRNTDRQHLSWRSSNTTVGAGEGEMEDEISGSGDSAENGRAGMEAEATARRMGRMSGRPVNLAKAQKTSQDGAAPSGRPLRHISSHVIDSEEEDEELSKAGKRISVSAIPPYIDGRPTIKTYFKIYSPSRAGRMLSVYESAPDKFNFSQSWGWKSSQMVLDDGINGLDGLAKGGRDGRLRYMVVIGNV